MNESPQAALLRALDAVGGQKALARHLGITQQSVSEWVARGVVPVGRVAEVARLARMSRARLRPDVFGTPPTSRT